jgi:hypothetical protein
MEYKQAWSIKNYRYAGDVSPPRLKTAKMEMKAKICWKIPA